MKLSDVLNFILQNQSFIITFITSTIIFSKFFVKRIFNIETRSDRKTTIKSELEFAKYLVDPNVQSCLVNQMVFEALTHQKASLETMKWLLECHDPTTALEIYAQAPKFIDVQNNKIKKVKWIVNHGFFIYYMSIVISIMILILISGFIFFSIDTLTNMNQLNPILNSKYSLPYGILLFFMVFDIIGLLWIMSLISNFGIFIAKVRRFYKHVPSAIIIRS